MWTETPQRSDEADFGNLLAVLRREAPDRPTLFEFILNEDLYCMVVPGPEPTDPASSLRRIIRTYHALGYDHATMQAPGFTFLTGMERRKGQTVSQNEGALIHNRQDFDRFQWPDPDVAYYEILDEVAEDVPKGMKLIPFSNNGVLENTINLLGYESLCYLLVDDPQLLEDVFAEVGSRLLRYYQHIIPYDIVGAVVANDDWGFNTNSLLAPADMRRLIFPWYRQIVEAAHQVGKPVILHSCG
jgi:uroporphyrinogen decarboxylase